MRRQVTISTAAAMVVLFALTAVQVFAQGKKQERVPRAPDIILPKAGSPPPPRLADGHIDLGNGNGTWFPIGIKDITGHGYAANLRNDELNNRNDPRSSQKGPQQVEKVVDVQMLPWAQKFFETANASLAKDDPEGYCLPPGIPRMAATPFPFQIYQLPDRLMFVYEGGAHMWHIVYTDGRPHAKDATDYPTYLGDGIGHWEGDAMVVDNIGFNTKTWIDGSGHPHTEKLHVIERFTRTSRDNLHYQATIDDPGAYAKPWTTSWNIPWVAGQTLLEYICQEENRDTAHYVGK